MVLRADGDVDAVARELELVVGLDRQTDHPDLSSDTDTLIRVRAERDRRRSDGR